MPKRRRHRRDSDEEDSEDDGAVELAEYAAPAPRQAGISAEHLQTGVLHAATA